MNIGDKVRFLTETGGGIVKAFKDKNTVLVECEDGFDIPMLISQVVVVGETDRFNFEHPQPAKTVKPAASTATVTPQQSASQPVKPSLSQSVKPEATKAIVQEFAGHDILNVHLAFLSLATRECFAQFVTRNEDRVNGCVVADNIVE